MRTGQPVPGFLSTTAGRAMTDSASMRSSVGAPRPGRWGLAVLAWLLLSLTLALQWWVGDRTLYKPAMEPTREALHFGILHNVPPEGKTWSDWGGYSVQRRVGVVYLAEAVRQGTGARVGTIYKAIDTLALFLSLVALYAYLQRRVGGAGALMGVLYLAALLPLTYLFALFHPWDRVQLLLWIVLLDLMERRAVIALGALLMLSVAVKPDTIFLPFLYGALHGLGPDRRRAVLEGVVLLALTWGAYFALGAWFPDPHGAAKSTGGVLAQIASNAADFRAANLHYPPLLMHALPFGLALASWKHSAHADRMHLLFALGMALIFFLFSNFIEVRAHTMLLVLVLPAALRSVQRLLVPDPSGLAPPPLRR